MTDSVETVDVSLRKAVDDSYRITVGPALLERAAGLLQDRKLPKRVAIVSDTGVYPLYGQTLRRALEAGGYEVAAEAVFEAGEASKTRTTKAWIEDRLLDARLGRDAWIAALGGGVVGDMAGFVAATYLRGIPFVQFPTTLLAMVDSSVGGKTGLDTPHGKNLVGAFWQPRAVIADVGLLGSLPADQFLAGLAESVKHAVIADAELFAFMRVEWERILARDPGVLQVLVARNCAIKARVVEQDEREGDLRKILNYGHTLGHAVETAADYAELHGMCVALGMIYEGRLAERLGLWSSGERQEVEAFLRQAGYPAVDTLAADSEILIRLTQADKKAREGKVEYVLPQRLGAMHRGERGYGVRVDDAEVLAVLREIRGR